MKILNETPVLPIGVQFDIIPAFTKGKSQLTPGDVEAMCRLANVRINIEHVI